MVPFLSSATAVSDSHQQDKLTVELLTCALFGRSTFQKAL
jgi:hypothetical protein